MNPFKKLRSWFRGPTDPEAIAEAQRLSDDRDTIRISQNIPMSQIGSPTNLAPTSDVLHPGEDSRK
jgi:hypothetical protein